MNSPSRTAAPDDPRLSEVCESVHDDATIKQVCDKAFPIGIAGIDPRLSEVCKGGHDDESFRKVCSEKFPHAIDKKEEEQTSIVYYLGYKYFLTHGPLEGRQENYNLWENDPEGKRLDRVSGLSLMVKWVERGKLIEWRNSPILSDLKVAARFETGVRDAFQFKTYRLEIGTKVLQLPIVAWGQIGYNSDLAQYYKKVNSWGVEVEIGSF